MNIVETMLIFAGIPVGIFLVVSAAVYGKTATTHTSRYRPGRPWTHEAVWYLPHPDDAPAQRPAPALTTRSESAVAAAGPERMGGASGEW